ncbi:hypothetical protein MCHI_002224 [Candidatus Magnetoovum chiemensis]|nr:hypothetical protein MCHI_002224 [Candidatus Magnetoovum chiemensis]
MKNILIIRTTSFQNLDRILKTLKITHNSIETITVLTHEHGKAFAEKYDDINTVLVYPFKGNFSVFKYPKNMENLRFDTTIIPVDNLTGRGYLNVYIFTLRINTKNRLTINKKQEIKPLSKKHIAFLTLNSYLYFTTSLMFTTITTATMLTLWSGNKIFGSIKKWLLKLKKLYSAQTQAKK